MENYQLQSYPIILVLKIPYKIELKDFKEYEMKRDYIGVNDVVKKLGISNATFWRMRKRGDFPCPAIQQPKRWKETDIDAFLGQE